MVLAQRQWAAVGRAAAALRPWCLPARDRALTPNPPSDSMPPAAAEAVRRASSRQVRAASEALTSHIFGQCATSEASGAVESTNKAVGNPVELLHRQHPLPPGRGRCKHAAESGGPSRCGPPLRTAHALVSLTPALQKVQGRSNRFLSLQGEAHMAWATQAPSCERELRHLEMASGDVACCHHLISMPSAFWCFCECDAVTRLSD